MINAKNSQHPTINAIPERTKSLYQGITNKLPKKNVNHSLIPSIHLQLNSDDLNDSIQIGAVQSIAGNASPNNSSHPDSCSTIVDSDRISRTMDSSRAEPVLTGDFPLAPANTERLSIPTMNSKRGSKKRIGDWMIGKVIGEGSSGKVKLAEHIITGQIVYLSIYFTY